MRYAKVVTVVLVCAISVGAHSEQTAKQKFSETYRLSVTTTTVYAHGKWVELQEKKDIPPSSGVVELKCSKSEMLCYDMEANLVTAGRPRIDVTELAILRWDETEIIASDEDSAICVRQSLTIDFRTRAVTWVDSPKLPLAESCMSIAGDAAKRASTYSLVATKFPNIGDEASAQ
jgi:hypothetical protein